MRILHYYWSQFDDDFRKGGGVKVYLNNILPFQVSEGHDVYMLNSGVDYTLVNRSCHIVPSGIHNGVHQFSVVNSPVMAPSKADFYGQKNYLENTVLKSVVGKFIAEYGPFDVIHFHSLEGLSLPVLELKAQYPSIKFIYSMHNYFPFCPQVNLWKNDHENCMNFHDGKDCEYCVGVLPSRASIQKYYQGITLMKKWEMAKVFDITMKRAKLYYQKMKKGSSQSVAKRFCDETVASNFMKFREQNIEYFNLYFDKILCVSKRVQTICQTMGIKKDLIECLYIGTDFARNQQMKPKYDIYGSPFQIAYIGYMRRDKGFYFFLESLKQMAPELAKKIAVIVAARNEDNNALQDFLALKNKFANIQYYNGYKRDNIQSILKGTHLGIVPVMWEDNLPQVAMELKAMGIPVLASDLGGASELSNCEAFRFRGGDSNDFLQHLCQIEQDRTLLLEYYDSGMALKTMSEHCKILERIYAGDKNNI